MFCMRSLRLISPHSTLTFPETLLAGRGRGKGGRRGGERKTEAKSQTRTIGRERPSESPVLSWIYLPGRWFLRSSAVFAERCVLTGAREALICPSHARRVSALVLMRMRARSNLFTNVGISMRYGDLAHSSSCVGRSLAAEVRGSAACESVSQRSLFSIDWDLFVTWTDLFKASIYLCIGVCDRGADSRSVHLHSSQEGAAAPGCRKGSGCGRWATSGISRICKKRRVWGTGRWGGARAHGKWRRRRSDLCDNGVVIVSFRHICAWSRQSRP